MSSHPYKHLPESRFWSTGVKAPVSDQHRLAIDPLAGLLAAEDTIVSGGSCFAQYIGSELSSRHFHYLKSSLSGERIESFGLGNIYTVAQFRQWLEFSLGNRHWSEDSLFTKDDEWFDLLLPHRAAMPSRERLIDHRSKISDEILEHIARANVLIFTVGLTETWTNPSGDIYPVCPGALVGEFDASKHHFHNCTTEEILADLKALESLLTQINAELRLIYTVSPVPLTATASESHVLVATTYSKSIIRAAVGQYCQSAARASYFPSFELINHHLPGDWRFESNLRSVSSAGVSYVMSHAFGDAPAEHTSSDSAPSPPPSGNNALIEAACEEELLNSYARREELTATHSNIILAGDCHMGKLADGFRANGVEVTGGIVMHGSHFTSYKFKLSQERILLPMDSDESKELWFNIHDKMTALKGDCHIITNIGFHTHITINTISNHCKSLVITEDDVADYFEEFYKGQLYILREFTRYGKVWMVEDPDFHAFIGNKNNAQVVRDKNFHQYCNYMRKVCREWGIEYLNPCDSALQQLFSDSKILTDIIAPDGFLGEPAYYQYCATVVNDAIARSVEAPFARAA